MALRDKLRERCTPLLEPGEQYQAAFVAQGGPSPWWVVVTWLILLFSGYYIIVATDRAIVVMKSGVMMAKPKQVLERLPRSTRIGPVQGAIWGKAELGGKRIWVHRRFHGDVAQIDSWAGPSTLPPPPPR